MLKWALKLVSLLSFQHIEDFNEKIWPLSKKVKLTSWRDIHFKSVLLSKQKNYCTVNEKLQYLKKYSTKLYENINDQQNKDFPDVFFKM